jgi:hypothetical protein
MKLLSNKMVLKQLDRPSPDCVLDAGPVLEYFDFGRGFGPSALILFLYWGITHVLTYLALRVVARKEKR